MTAVQAERCGVTLVIANRAAECWQHPLQADTRVMTQALVNLLANAIAFTPPGGRVTVDCDRSEEHTSELQSLMRISYAVFCLKKKNEQITNKDTYTSPECIPHTHPSD